MKNLQHTYRCRPAKGGRIEKERNKSGACFTIERVAQDGRKGFVTVLHNRASGRKVGYAGDPKPGQVCRITPDPFAAAITPKNVAVNVGVICSRTFSAPKKAKGKRKAKK